MINYSDVRIFFCSTPTDMNCSFDRLMGRVQEVFDEDPLSGHLFLFVNRNRDRMKILFWDRDGFCIWYKSQEAERPEMFVFPEFEFTAHNPCVGTIGLGFLVSETPRLISWRRIMDGGSNVSVPPPRLNHSNVPLTRFWELLKPNQRERTLSTLSRVVAKQLAPLPVEEEVGDD